GEGPQRVADAERAEPAHLKHGTVVPDEVGGRRFRRAPGGSARPAGKNPEIISEIGFEFCLAFANRTNCGGFHQGPTVYLRRPGRARRSPPNAAELRLRARRRAVPHCTADSTDYARRAPRE